MLKDKAMEYIKDGADKILDLSEEVGGKIFNVETINSIITVVDSCSKVGADITKAT